MNSGAGILLIARDTQRVLLALRSRHVSHPGVWSPPGGKIEDGETPGRAARRELGEEVGHLYRGKLLPIFVYESPGLQYHNFVGTVPHEFVPVLNAESDDARWFDPNELPKNLHFGMKVLMNDRNRFMRTNPMPNTNLIDALRTLAGKTRALTLAEYMRLEKILSAAKPYPLAAFRQSILKAISETVLYRADGGDRERYAITRKYSAELLRTIEESGGVPIEILFVIASASLPRWMRRIDPDRARMFGGDVASVALKEYDSGIWEQDWLWTLVPVRSL
jgi:8-oxo-dGTP pyrophosphatase MutT (NUDIX family)